MFDAWREQFDDQWTDSFLQEEAKFRMLKKQKYSSINNNHT